MDGRAGQLVNAGAGWQREHDSMSVVEHSRAVASGAHSQRRTLPWRETPIAQVSLGRGGFISAVDRIFSARLWRC